VDKIISHVVEVYCCRKKMQQVQRLINEIAVALLVAIKSTP